MRTPEIVVLGGPNAGKTHYGGQIYGRIRDNLGELRLRKDKGTPADLSAFKEVLECLENGRAAEHTSARTWAEIFLPLVDTQGHALDLRWPDYGGEQIRSVFTARTVTEDWQSRLAKADGWILLIRLSTEVTYQDDIEQLGKRIEERTLNAGRPGKWDPNAWWVELLQILLHVGGHGHVKRIRTPRLAVLLSCYDEPDHTKDPPTNPPREVLAERLPLVSSFIESNWAPDSVSVWGLSALGKLLEKNSEDDGFIDDGPETKGWVIAPEGGAPDPDLTRPIAWLVEAL